MIEDGIGVRIKMIFLKKSGKKSTKYVAHSDVSSFLRCEKNKQNVSIFYI